jgi:phasin
MTAMTAIAKTKAARPAATPAEFFDMPKFDVPKFEFPNFAMPQIEVPAAFRQYAEKGAAQAKVAYDKVKANAEEANGIIEATYSTASKAAAVYGLKLTETARVNVNAAFDFAQDLWTAKSASELIGLSAEHGRKQFEVLVAQTKELSTLAQKLAAETAAPAKSGFEKAFRRAA